MSLPLALVTGNKGKAAEISAILGRPIDPVPLVLAEIQSLDVADVGRAKAAQAWDRLRRPLIVDDTGFAMQALNGLPGPFIAWFLDKLGPAGVLALVAGNPDRRVRVTTCIAYADSRGVRVFLGHADGTLPDRPRDGGGFGYDPIFIPDGYALSYAELGPKIKNEISMRRKALDGLKAFLEE